MELQCPIQVPGQAGGGGAGQIASRAGNARERPQRTAPAGQAWVQALQPKPSEETSWQQIAAALNPLEKPVSGQPSP